MEDSYDIVFLNYTLLLQIVFMNESKKQPLPAKRSKHIFITKLENGEIKQW